MKDRTPSAPAARVQPALSVVVPAYRAAGFVGDRLPELSAFLQRCPFPHELIVVDDGSRDGTADAVRELRLPHARVLELPENRGKFGALASGVEASDGRCVLFTDADVPYDLAALSYMTELVLGHGFQVVVGDRTLPESSTASVASRFRRAVSFAARHFVRLFVTGGIYDSQCGIKAFDGEVARTLFPLLLEHGFAGDVELLYVALRYNLSIRRVPVRLVHQAPTSIRFHSDGPALLAASVRIRARRRLGRYASPRLRELAEQRYWLEE